MDKQIYIGYEKESALIKNVFKLYPETIPPYWNSNIHIKDFFKKLNTWLDENIVYNKKQYEFMVKKFVDCKTSQNINDLRRIYEDD
jgi:predicted N-acyltransferase